MTPAPPRPALVAAPLQAGRGGGAGWLAGLAAVLVVLGGCADAVAGLHSGVAEGRAGVELLDAGDPTGAEGAFVSGLASPDVPRDVQASLWHALGLVRARRQAVAEADSAFVEAIARADDPATRARYATDAGAAALLGDDPARAVDLLRRALVLDPGSGAARRNYEIARRRLAANEPPRPSPFAEEVKARADSLVAARQYPAALDVMEEGLRQDSSVAVYADFIGRLTGVVDIETGGPETLTPAP